MSSPALEWVDILYESTYFRSLKDKRMTHDDFWKEFGIYDIIIQHSSYPGKIADRICDLIVPGTKILDIGAGTGAFSIPLARLASELVAIDPSPYHLEILAEKCIENDIHNVRYLREEWKDVNKEKYADVLDRVDYTVSAYSIIDPDIASFIQKMYDVSAKGIFIVYRAGDPDPLEIFAHGRKRSIDYQYIVRVMQSMGLNACVEITERKFSLPIELVRHKYRNSERSWEELYTFIVENGRLHSSSVEPAVSFSTGDAVIHILKDTVEDTTLKVIV